MTRVILFTGKGGVGKTSIAAATALRCADEGASTLLLSTDPAHSISDSVGQPIGHDPVAVTDRLWAQESDLTLHMERSWDDIRSYLQALLQWAGLDEIHAQELALIPGFEEVLALSALQRAAESGRWDVVVVDCAPTAETIRLLSIPDVLRWYMDRLFPLSKRVSRVVGPVITRLSSVPVASAEVFDAVERLYEDLSAVNELLSDGTVSSVRLVTNAEHMVVEESRKTHTYLSLFGYWVDAVIVNRILPDAVTDPWFEAHRLAQQEQLRRIDEGFADTPIYHAELLSQPLQGLDALRQMGSVYGAQSPREVLAQRPPYSFSVNTDSARMTMHVGKMTTEDIDLGAAGRELFIKIGPYRRAMLLPESLAGRTIRGARVEGEQLVLEFGSRSEHHDRGH